MSYGEKRLPKMKMAFKGLMESQPKAAEDKGKVRERDLLLLEGMPDPSRRSISLPGTF